MVKAKFGDSVRSKSNTGQINEALCKGLCHNICVLVQAIHEFGIEPTFGAKPPEPRGGYANRPTHKVVDTWLSQRCRNGSAEFGF